MDSQFSVDIETNFLDMISSPSELKLLNRKQIKLLTKEVRSRIIKTVSKNGGHLASNLGVVELTIALNYVFSPPKDRIVFDVGHQSYTYKLLTGRSKNFGSLRQHKGISGFPKREESICDSFNTGHASTSISAALGIAKARDLKNENYKVIAVVGDGALTGGMSFEALNHAGALKTDLLVVLNDNEMSISPNVGALSKYLTRMVTSPKYHEIRQKTELLLKKLPKFGDIAAKKAFELEDWIRAMSAQGLFFKEMGFHYFGPIDGHNLDELVLALNNIKSIKGPVLLHVITKKGKGYSHAENNNAKFHGVNQFNIYNGEDTNCSTNMTFTSAFSKALTKLAEQDKSIVAITAAMKLGTGLEEFAKNYPNRFFDVGIAEQHAVTFAAGLASQGFKPVCAIYSTFLQRSYDQILHDVCLQNLNVTFAIDRAGLVGEDGPTHHGSFDLSFLRHIPNMVIAAPKDENELQHLLKTAIDYNGPAAIRYPRGCGIGAKMDKAPMRLKIGKSEVVKHGSDVAIFAVGHLVYEAIEAAKELKEKGIKAMVINARFIKPLDEKLILYLTKKIKNIITIEENSLQGGFGSSLLELLEKNKIKANIKRIGLPDKFIEHGPLEILRKNYGLTKENIVKAVEDL